MPRLMFAIVALLLSSSLGAAPPPTRAPVQGENADAKNYAADEDRDEDADADDDSDERSDRDVEDDADDQSDRDDEVSDQDSDEQLSGDRDRPVARHRTRAEYVRNLRAKVHRIAVRRVAVAHHRRSYVHQRYLRKPGPFYRPTYRRQQQSNEDTDD